MKSFVFIFVTALAAIVTAPAQTVLDNGVLNSGSYNKGQPVAPGSLISIFGNGLASTTASADTVPLSNKLANVSVAVNGIPTPLLGVAHLPAYDQIAAQLPMGVLPQGVQNGTAQVVVSNNGTAGPAFTFQVTAAAPGIFTTQANGLGQAWAYGNLDGQVAAPAGSIPGLTTHPAKINDPNTLVILATGLGAVDPPVPDGNNALDGQLHRAVITPVVLVGNVQAQVAFAGLSPQFVGVYQINIVIAPGTPTGDAVPIQISSNGVLGNPATIAAAQ